MEKDYYVYSAEILISGTRAFLEEKLPAQPNPGHLIGLLSAPLDELMPMLSQSSQAAKLLDPLLEDYRGYGPTELLEEIKILAIHLVKKAMEKEREAELSKAQAEASQIMRHYGANSLPQKILYPPLRKELLPQILIDKLRCKYW